MSFDLDAARALIGSGELAALSLDVFDTFLYRRAAAPDGVFERAFERLPAALRQRIGRETFLQHRVLAEGKARRKKRRRTDHSEVTIEEIYGEFPVRLLGAHPEARDALVEAEFQAELDLCLVNPDMLGLQREARALGLRVGFISDTYWPRARLERLLRRGAPDLVADFVYCSCEHGHGKADGLLRHYLRQERLPPERALHLGDNPGADVAPAQALGMRAIHYPQAPSALLRIFAREDTVGRLLQGERPAAVGRLDDGLRLLRRLAMRRLASEDAADIAGAAILGPVLAGFRRFLQQRVAGIAAPARRVEVAFLARDGFLLKRAWDEAGLAPAHYLEINRRIALIGSTEMVQPLQDFFDHVPKVDRVAVRDYLKTRIPGIEAFFDRHPVVTGSAFAKRLPELINAREIQRLSQAMRRQLLDHIAASIGGFDGCTDLVLVDIGYFGTIQRSLRQIFRREGIATRLHGAYLMTASDAFDDLGEGDSVEGFLDDAALSPRTMRGLLRNVAVLEQLFSAPTGSVRSYAGGQVERESECRPPGQIALAAAAQRAALGFLGLYPELALWIGGDPLADPERARDYAAVLLTRLLLLPVPEEMRELGGLQHDINLGSRAAVPLLDRPSAERALDAMAFSKVCSIGEPPMWLAGSLGAVSSGFGHAYCLNAFGLLPGDVFADLPEREVLVAIIKAGVATPLQVAGLRTGFGDFRLRIPVRRSDTGCTVAVSLDSLAPSGVIKVVTLQHGESARDALDSQDIETMAPAAISGLRARIDARHFQATGADSYLLVPVPVGGDPLTILTVTLALASPWAGEAPPVPAIAAA